MTTQQEGLTESEITAIQDHFAPIPTETGRTETAATYVVAMGQDEDEELKTTTVCRERGRLAVLDSVGHPVAEGGSLEEVLAAA